MGQGTRRALLGWCGVVVLFGAGLAGAGLPETDEFTRWAFGLLGRPEMVFTPELRFAVALMGAVTLGWGLMMGAAAASCDRIDLLAARLLWRRIAAAAVAWYLIDSLLSVATGFALNAVSNTIFLAALFVILWRGGTFAPGIRSAPA